MNGWRVLVDSRRVLFKEFVSGIVILDLATLSCSVIMPRKLVVESLLFLQGILELFKLLLLVIRSLFCFFFYLPLSGQNLGQLLHNYKRLILSCLNLIVNLQMFLLLINLVQLFPNH